MDYRLRIKENGDVVLVSNGEEIHVAPSLEIKFLRSVEVLKDVLKGKLWSGPEVFLPEGARLSEEFPYLIEYLELGGKTVYISKACTDMFTDIPMPKYTQLDVNPIGRAIEDDEVVHWRDTRYITRIGLTYFLLDLDGSDSATTTVLLVNKQVLPLHMCVELDSRFSSISKELSLNIPKIDTHRSTSLISIESRANAATYSKMSKMNSEAMSQTVRSIIKGDEV